jgi:hypothetical protein
MPPSATHVGTVSVLIIAMAMMLIRADGRFLGDIIVIMTLPWYKEASLPLLDIRF